MRAIIIEDKDAKDLVDQLELAKLRETGFFRSSGNPTFEEIHRVFHFVVVRWLQDQGANVI